MKRFRGSRRRPGIGGNPAGNGKPRPISKRLRSRIGLARANPRWPARHDRDDEWPAARQFDADRQLAGNRLDFYRGGPAPSRPHRCGRQRLRQRPLARFSARVEPSSRRQWSVRAYSRKNFAAPETNRELVPARVLAVRCAASVVEEPVQKCRPASSDAGVTLSAVMDVDSVVGRSDGRPYPAAEGITVNSARCRRGRRRSRFLPHLRLYAGR